MRRPAGPLVRRQTLATRLTHWVWAVALFFLLLTGLQILNAHPVLYWGAESGFDYDNAVLRLGAAGKEGAGPIPSWATIPSTRDLATGRVIHFFFAWVFGAVLVLWLAAALWSGHWRDLVPTRADLRALPRDVADHARLRLHHGRAYGPLQKLAYAGVLFGLFPLMVLTGLAMSPSFNAAAPWVLDLLGGRQSARTLHFAGMAGLVAFFAIHIAMIGLAGPLNLMRSMVTGWTRIDADTESDHVR
jgi:thiosulfate reductase cytochrome b subunit